MNLMIFLVQEEGGEENENVSEEFPNEMYEQQRMEQPEEPKIEEMTATQMIYDVVSPKKHGRKTSIVSNREGGVVAQLIERNSELWSCKSCGKTAKSKGNILQHAETHVEGLSFPCKRCDQTFR